MLESGQQVSVIQPGQHNPLAGPDFLDARIRIDETLWAGHVEIHVNASDWYAHRHEKDPAYENVILHAVWNNDVPVLGKDDQLLPTLELQRFLQDDLYSSYKAFLERQVAFIPCEREIAQVDAIITRSWLERLYLERLQRKVNEILKDLERTKGDWEAIFFLHLAMGFGTKINKQAFTAMAGQIPFRVLCKTRTNWKALEALLMGAAGLLDKSQNADPYLLELCEEFDYLKRKFELSIIRTERAHFFKLRPMNFPTVRLSQLAGLYHLRAGLMSQCIEVMDIGMLYKILRVGVSPYWETHYTFGKVSASKAKITSSSFLNALLINVILPFKYAYSRSMGQDPWSEIIQLIQQLPPEKNTIVTQFAALGVTAHSALETQSLLELHNYYCKSKRCLDCAIGHRLLGRM